MFGVTLPEEVSEESKSSHLSTTEVAAYYYLSQYVVICNTNVTHSHHIFTLFKGRRNMGSKSNRLLLLINYFYNICHYVW